MKGQAAHLRAEFEKSVFRLQELPEPTMAEVAFAGRSNVGKSSLLNRILGRHNLVRVSSRPGFTQSLNFFVVNNTYRFVDLPGYGYAKAPRSAQEKWRRLIEGYLQARQVLGLVVCLMDIRREPDPLDQDLLSYLDHLGKSQLIVFNKADKISQPQRARRLKAISERLGGERTKYALLVSARTGEGVERLLERIWLHLARPNAGR